MAASFSESLPWPESLNRLHDPEVRGAGLVLVKGRKSGSSTLAMHSASHCEGGQREIQTQDPGPLAADLCSSRPAAPPSLQGLVGGRMLR